MKSKLKEFFKDNKWILLTFGLSSLVIVILYSLQKIAPFGNNSMLDVDFYHQYGPMLNELYDRVKQGESLLFSFNTGGGIPFYRNFLNYLSSPFNLILFLFKKENIVMAFSIIIALKAIASSVTMAFFLKKAFKKDNVLISIFGLLYAFSGYFCAYYWNIMWLDGMVFLPLITLGIIKIIDEEKPLLYMIFLSIMLLANYFIGYMICIFSVLFFIGYFCYKGNFKIKNIFRKFFLFGFFSLLSAGLVAVLLLPLFYSLSSISATSDSFINLAFNFNILDYLYNHIPSVSRTVFASDVLPLPNVYSGLITLVLIILFFINKKINKKAKVLAILALLFFFFSFNITVFDFIWHAFHVPNDLPWRYSFIYTFVLITIAYYSAIRIKKSDLTHIIFAFGTIFIIVISASKYGFQNLTNNKIIVCAILLVLYFFIYLVSQSNNKYKNCWQIFLSLLVIFECVYSINSNWQINHDIEIFMSDKKPYQELINYARKDDNGLYRLEKTDNLTLNDGSWYDYYGITTFSSMAYESVSKFQRMFGMPGNNINSYYYKGYQTPIYNTMFNIKYLMGNYTQNDYYVPLKNIDGHELIGYNYSSSIAYMVDSSIKDWTLVSYMPFLNQENFVSYATKVQNIYEGLKADNVSGGKIISGDFCNNPNGEFVYELSPGSTSLSFDILNDENQNLYFYVGGSNISNFQIENTYYSVNSDEYYVIDGGKFNKGRVNVTINFDSEESSDIKFYAYKMNDGKFKEFYDELSKGFLNVKKYNETYIEGDVTAEDNQVLFTTISYDEGWSAYVDGKKVKTYKIADSYLAFDVEKGKHNIKLVYYPKGMKEGLIISAVSVFLLFAYLLFFEKSNKIEKR